MLARILVGLVVVSAAAPASALEACFADSIGPWRGPVWNGTGIQSMDTLFEIGTDGAMVGRYHIEDAQPFDGTLTGFRPTGDCEADFTWIDRDGTGTVHIHFDPDRGEFQGRWGRSQPLPSLLFDGYRLGPPRTS